MATSLGHYMITNLQMIYCVRELTFLNGKEIVVICTWITQIEYDYIEYRTTNKHAVKYNAIATLNNESSSDTKHVYCAKCIVYWTWMVYVWNWYIYVLHGRVG